MTTILDAAQRRAANTAAPADRPSQRRSDENGPSNVTRAMSASMSLRAAEGDTGTMAFEGHASVYERGYEMWDMFGPYTEIVSAGAATESLAREDLSVPLVLDHDPMRRIALTDNGTLTLSEDEVGLHVLAPALDPADHDVAYIAPKMRAGLITEMSFRFRITSGQWSPDYTEYRINSFDIHRGDVAIVGYGANPYTDGAVRSAVEPRQQRGRRGADLIGPFDTARRTVAGTSLRAADGDGMLTPRQAALVQAYEGIAEIHGPFDQSIGPDGAHYVAASPFAAEGMVCSSCALYEGPRSCDVVAGDIDPGAVCKLWVIPQQLLP